MAILSFDIHSDYTELLKAQQEADNLRRKLAAASMTPGSSERTRLESQLISATARLRDLETQALRSGREIEMGLKQSINAGIGSITGAVDKLSDPLRAIPSALGLTALTGFIAKMAHVRGEFEKMETSINVLVGETKGKKLMAQLTDFAKVSPLDFKGTVGGAQQMLGFGIDADKVPKFLSAIGDVSMGDPRRFSSLTLAFSQMSATGKLMGQDLNQMINAGFNPLQTIAEKTGKSIGTLKDEMSKGKISSEMVQQAFIDATSEGGKFYQMAEKGSATIEGQSAKLGDSIDLMFNEIGEKGQGVIVSAIEGATAVVENWKTVGTAAMSLAGVVGVYQMSLKAAEIVRRNEAEKASAAEADRTKALKAGLDEEIEKRKAIAEMHRIDSSYDVDIAASIKGGGLTENEAKGLQSLRQKTIYNELDERERVAKASADEIKKALDKVDADIDANEAKIQQLRDSLANTTDDDTKDLINNQISEASGMDTYLQRKRGDLVSRRDSNNLDIEAIEHERDVIKARQKVKAMEIEAVAKGEDPIIAQSQARIEQLKKENQEVINNANNAVKRAQNASLEKGDYAMFKQSKYDESVSSGASSDLVEKARAEAEAANAEWEKSNRDLQALIRERDKIVRDCSADIEVLDEALSSRMDSDNRNSRIAEAKEMAEAAEIEKCAALEALEAAKTRQEMQAGDSIDFGTGEYIPTRETEEYEAAVQNALIAQRDLNEAIQDLDGLDVAGYLDDASESASDVSDSIAAVAESINNITDSGESAADAINDATESLSDNTSEQASNATATQAAASARSGNTSAAGLNNTAVQQNTAAVGVNNASQNASAVATRRSAIARAANTVKTQAATIAEHLHTKAIEGTRNAMNSLKAAWASNPFGLILTAVTTVVGALMTWKSHADESTDATRQYGEDASEASNKVNMLYSVMKATAKDSKTHKDAINELAQITKDYGLKLDDEKDKYSQLLDKKRQLISLIQEEARQRVYAAHVEDMHNEVKSADDKVIEVLKADIEQANILDEIKAEKKTLASLMYGDIQTNQTEIDALLAQLDIANAEIAEKRRTLTGSALMDAESQYRASRVAIEQELAKLSTSSVGSYLSNQGIKYTNSDAQKLAASLYGQWAGGVKDGFLSSRTTLTEALGDANEARRQLDSYTTAMNNANDASEKLRDTVEKPINEQETDKVLEKLSAAMKQIGDINSEPVAPKGIPDSLESLIEKARKTKESVTEAGNTSANPSSDGSALDDTTIKAKETKGALDDINDSKTSIDIDVSQVIGAIAQLVGLKRAIKDAGGNVTNLHYNKEQGEMWDALIKKYKDKNGKFNLSELRKNENDSQLYDSLLRTGQNNLIFKKAGKDYVMTDSQATQMDYFRNRYASNGKIKVSEMTAEDKAVFERLSYEIEKDAYDKGQAEAAKTVKAYKENISDRIKKAKTTDDISKLRKELSTELKKVDQGSAEYRYYESLINRLDAKDRTKNTPESAAQRAYAEQKRKDEETRRQAENAAVEAERIENLRISRMSDGYEKEVATIRAGESKKLREINKAADEEARRLLDADRKAWVNAGYKRQEYNFKPSKSTDEYRKQAEANIGYDTQIATEKEANAKKIKELTDKELLDMQEYLVKYGDNRQKILAEEKKYRMEMEKAKSTSERLALSHEFYAEKDRQNREMREREADRRSSGIVDNDIIFQNLDILQVEALDQLEVSLQELMKDSNLSAESLASVANRLRDVKGELSSRRNFWETINPFKGMGEDLKKKLDNEISVARDEFNAAKARNDKDSFALFAQQQRIADMLNIKSGTMDYKANNITPENTELVIRKYVELGGDEKEITDAIGLLGTLANNARESGQIVSNAAQNVSKAESAMSMFSQSWGSGASGAATTEAIIRGVNANIQSMSEFIDDLGLSATKFGQGFASFAESSQYAVNAFDSLKNGDVVGVAMNLNRALGSLGNALGQWGIAGMGSSDVNLSRDIERLTASNEALINAIGMLTDEMSDASVVESYDLYLKQLENIQNAASNTAEMMQRSASVNNKGFLGIGGKHSSNKKIDDAMSTGEWQRISDIFGDKAIKSAKDFFNLTSDEMYKIASNAPDLYAKIKQLAKDGYGDASQWMDEYIEYGKQIEELAGAYREKVTGTSFDSVSSEFTSTLLDMESSGMDFANNFEEMMRNAVISAMVSNLFKNDLEQWYKDFAEAMGDDGQLGADEMARLKAQYEDIAKRAMEQKDILNDTLGLDDIYKQEASRGSWESLGEETGQELNGRFAAIQITAENIRLQNEQQTISLANLTAAALQAIESGSQMTGIATRIEAQMAQCFVELQSISANTGAIVKPIISMQSDMAEIKKNTKNL